jgi:hypothetical protein
MKSIYYVYVYLDPRKPGKYMYNEYEFDYEPFYIGKGSNGRAYHHLTCHNQKRNNNKNFINRIKKIQNEIHKDPIVIICKNNLLENVAYQLEMKMVKIIGRKDLKKGPLYNLTDGGDGVLNVYYTDEIRQKMRILNSGKNNPRYGDHRTWIELHGVEKAEQLRQQQIENFTGHKGLSEAMTKRLSVWNPMDNPESREKVRQSKLGIKNPQAIYDYYFTKEDGTEIKVECLREYCKEHPELRRASVITAVKTGKKYKNMFIRKVLKNDRIKRNPITSEISFS